MEVRRHLGPGFWKPRCGFPDAWALDLGPEPEWLAWHCSSPVGTAGPRPLGGVGGGGAELAGAVGTDAPGRKPWQAGQDFWGKDPPPLPTLYSLPSGKGGHLRSPRLVTQSGRAASAGRRLPPPGGQDFSPEWKDPCSLLSRNMDGRDWHWGLWLAQ